MVFGLDEQWEIPNPYNEFLVFHDTETFRYTYGLVATATGVEIGGYFFDGTSVYASEPPNSSLGTAFTMDDKPFEFGPDSDPLMAFWLYREAAAVPEPHAGCLALAACLVAWRLRGFA